MSYPSAIRLGRLAAEGQMADEFTAYSHTLSTVNGMETPVWTQRDVTRGKVRAKAAGMGRESDTNTRVINLGGVEVPVVDAGLHIPISAVVPERDWEYVCTAVGADTDPAVLGTRWRVIDVPVKSFATARRLDVVRV